MKFEVFISYSSEDEDEFKDLKSRLETASLKNYDY